MPVLAELQRTAGSKFVTLIHRLDIPRDSLQRTLGALIDARLVMRNPGYGHPLRPEYILTARGSRVARGCRPLLDLLEHLQVEQIGLKKWSMPLLAALRSGPLRFSELKAGFPGLTARSLTLALKDLEAAGLIARAVIDTYPPATRYELTRAGRRFSRSVQRLAAVLH